VRNSFRNAVYVRTGNPVDYIDLPLLRTVILRLSQQPAKAWKRRRPQGASSKRVDLAPEQILQAASDGSVTRISLMTAVIPADLFPDEMHFHFQKLASTEFLEVLSDLKIMVPHIFQFLQTRNFGAFEFIYKNIFVAPFIKISD